MELERRSLDSAALHYVPSRQPTAGRDEMATTDQKPKLRPT